MIQQTKRYGFVKQLVFKGNDVTNLLPGVSVGAEETLDLIGLSIKSFFILGVKFFPYIIDMVGPPPGPAKYYNPYDPSTMCFAYLRTADTPHLFGDDIELTMTGNWDRTRIWLFPGIWYNWFQSPIFNNGSSIKLGWEAEVDQAIVPYGTIQLQVNWLISIGADMPIKLATGESIPPPVIDFP